MTLQTIYRTTDLLIRPKQALQKAVDFFSRLFFCALQGDKKLLPDASFAALRKSLYAAEDEADIEVEDQAGALQIGFEDGTRFVVSPNAPVRQVWISSLTTSFKLDWSDAAGEFVLTKTGEALKPLVARLINQQLGEELVTLS